MAYIANDQIRSVQFILKIINKILISGQCLPHLNLLRFRKALFFVEDPLQVRMHVILTIIDTCRHQDRLDHVRVGRLQII